MSTIYDALQTDHYEFLIACRDAMFVAELRVNQPEVYELFAELLGFSPNPGPALTRYVEGVEKNETDIWYQEWIAQAVVEATECRSCHQLLRPVPEFFSVAHPKFLNVLIVNFDGGDNYGFLARNGLSSRRSEVAGYKLYERGNWPICHDCAHAMCEALPWLSELFGPEHSHTHSGESWWSEPAAAITADHVCVENNNCCMFHMWYKICESLAGPEATRAAWYKICEAELEEV